MWPRQGWGQGVEFMEESPVPVLVAGPRLLKGQAHGEASETSAPAEVLFFVWDMPAEGLTGRPS